MANSPQTQRFTRCRSSSPNDSRRVVLAKDREHAVLEFTGYGTDDDAVARAAFDAEIPATFTPFTNALVRLNFDCLTLGGVFWRATANYGPDPAPLLPAVGIVGPPAPVPAGTGASDPLGAGYAIDIAGVVATNPNSERGRTAIEAIRNLGLEVGDKCEVSPGFRSDESD